MTKSVFRLSLVQFDIAWENPPENFRRVEELLSRTADDSQAVILPEAFHTGFSMRAGIRSLAEKYPALPVLKKWAAASGKIIAASAFVVEEGHLYNRFFWVRPDGTFDTYDKKHLFTYGGEHRFFTPGTERKIIREEGWLFKPQICYDLRFPVWASNTFDKSTGTYAYDVLVYVANWPAKRRDAYMKLLPARAVENQAYVIWVNRTGEDGNGISYAGDTCLVSPDGDILATAGNDEKVLEVSLDPALLQSVREKMPLGPDRDAFDIL